MSASCCMNNARASAGIEARESIGTAHQLTVGARPALVTRALVRTPRDGRTRGRAIEDGEVANGEAVRVGDDFDILARAVAVTVVLVTVVDCKLQ